MTSSLEMERAYSERKRYKKEANSNRNEQDKGSKKLSKLANKLYSTKINEQINGTLHHEVYIGWQLWVYGRVISHMIRETTTNTEKYSNKRPE